MYDKTGWPSMSMTSSLSLMILIAVPKAVRPVQIAAIQCLDHSARSATAEWGGTVIACHKNSFRMAVHSQDTARLQYRTMNLSLIVQYAAHWR
jgi:hypothetical protein